MNHNPKFDVIVCGSLHLDIVVRGADLPRLDETAVGQSWEKVCGGKGGNQAVQAAKFGAKTAMIGQVGKDDFGETLLQHLRSVGVETKAVMQDPTSGSGMSVAIVQNDGDYGAVIVSGANLKIDPETLSESWRILGGAKVLVLQNEVPHAVNVAAATWAREQGAWVVHNAAPARPLAADLDRLVDVLVVNRVEAEMMSGLTVRDRSSAVACLTALGGATRSVIVTLGGTGLVVKEKAKPAIEIDALAVKVQSSHGAGDCFVGVLAGCLAAGDGLEAASRAANKKAAAFVSGA